MKKWLAILLAACLLMTAFPVTAFAAENNSAAAAANPTSGVTGDCVWTYDEDSQTLTVSGSGAMANYQDSTVVPWFQWQGKIKYLVIENGVTTIGDSAFAFCGGIGYADLPESVTAIGNEAFKSTGVTSVWLPEGLTSIGVSAFRECAKLWQINFPESLQSIGQAAFVGTAMQGAVLPSSSVQIGYYALGYDKNAKKTDGFTLTGKAKSTAQGYANSNGFTFIDIDAQQYALRVYMGRAVNLVTGEVASKARAGERFRIEKHPDNYFNLTGYTSDELTLEERDGEWYFTMPDNSATVYVDGAYAKRLTVNFNGADSVPLEPAAYTYFMNASQTMRNRRLADLGDGAATFDLNSDGTADVRIERYRAVRLNTATVAKSIVFADKGAAYAPVSFVFAGEVIDSAAVTVTLPEAGDSYDYNTDSAEVYVYDDRFTVAEAKWYNEWGIAPPAFEGGEKYFVDLLLRPKDGYVFSGDTRVTAHGEGMLDGTACPVYEWLSNGDIRVSTMSVYVPGDAHAIYMEGGMAADHEDEHNSFRALTDAKAGEVVWLSIGTDNVPEGSYVVPSTLQYTSDDVIIEGEAQPFFIMPDEDVQINITYETDKQVNGVMDLRGGKRFEAMSYGDSSTDYCKSQAYGVSALLHNKSAAFLMEDYAPLGKTIEKFDIDGDETFDIGRDGDAYFLLDANSLSSPTGQLTLSLSHEDSLLLPMRSLKLIFAEPTVQKHTITVNNGLATSDGVHRLTEAYPGEQVYLEPDVSLMHRAFVVQNTFEATSADVSINNEGDTFFVMPDRDVTVDVTYETRPLLEGVMDLSSGSYTADTGERYAVSEDYGMYFILQATAFRSQSGMDSEGHFTFRFDLDNCGGYDVGYDSTAHTYTLLDENSLRPASGRVTLRLPDSGYYTVPMHELTICLTSAGEGQVKHRITVNGGVAASEKSYSYLIAAQYPGEMVYLLPDDTVVPDDKYIHHIDCDASEELQWCDGGDFCFIMPDSDVTIDFTVRTFDKSPCTLDFSSGDVYTPGDPRSDEIAEAIEAGAAKTETVDEDGGSFVRYDVDGDGKFDIKRSGDTYTLLHHDFTGFITLTCDRQQALYLPVYPITIVFTQPLKGDVNSDGRVDIADATALQRALAEFSDALLDFDNSSVSYACDVNGDGCVNVHDVTALQRQLAEM